MYITFICKCRATCKQAGGGGRIYIYIYINLSVYLSIYRVNTPPDDHMYAKHHIKLVMGISCQGHVPSFVSFQLPT